MLQMRKWELRSQIWLTLKRLDFSWHLVVFVSADFCRTTIYLMLPSISPLPLVGFWSSVLLTSQSHHPTLKHIYISLIGAISYWLLNFNMADFKRSLQIIHSSYSVILELFYFSLHLKIWTRSVMNFPSYLRILSAAFLKLVFHAI